MLVSECSYLSTKFGYLSTSNFRKVQPGLFICCSPRPFFFTLSIAAKAVYLEYNVYHEVHAAYHLKLAWKTFFI